MRFERHMKRRSARSFDPRRPLPREALEALVSAARLAPSALNLQPVAFVVCTESATKERLRAAAFDQQKIADAAAVVVLAADLELASRARSMPELSCFESDRLGEWFELAERAYGSRPDRCRDEAFRSGGLSAMALLLAAEEAGLASAPVGGFDPEAVSQAVHLPPGRLPVLLVALGYPGPKPPLEPRPPRAADGLHWERWTP
ncbi:MAG: nitroreductase family protein [Fimbriimonadales bacterium]|nr:nitroreductase family protein [Fimbriimonadales bacterium]